MVGASMSFAPPSYDRSKPSKPAGKTTGPSVDTAQHPSVHWSELAQKIESSQRAVSPAATPVVQRKGEPPVAKARAVGPAVLGGVFQAYIRMGLEGQIGGAKIAPAQVVRVKTLSDAGFRSAWADYCERSGVPRQEPADNLNGFVDPTYPDGQTGFIREAGGFGTVIHETLHQLAFSGFRDGYGRAMNEGATELFTRVVLAANKAGIERSAYPKEYAAMLRLQGICGLAKLAEFYFGGDGAGVIGAVGNKRFFEFTQAMGQEDPDTAIAVL